MLILIIHLFTCLWYATIQIKHKFVYTQDFYYVGTTRLRRSFDDHEYNLFDQYVMCFFQIICALGGNEVAPRGNWEIFVIWFILVFLVMYLAIIFGEMALLVGMCTKKETDFQEQIDTANTAMEKVKLGEHLQEEVREFLKTTQGTKYEQEEQKEFLKILSPSLS